MARRRWIDPSFWDDLSISKLRPIERLFFIGCISNADDEGRLIGNPAYLRATIFKYDDLSVEEITQMRDCVASVNGNLMLYTVDGEEYLAFRTWSDYQRPNYPKESKLPAPPEDDEERCRPAVGETSDRENTDAMVRVGLVRVGLDRVGQDRGADGAANFSSQWQLIRQELENLHDRQAIRQQFTAQTSIREVTEAAVIISVPAGDLFRMSRLKPKIAEAIGAVCPEWAEREVVLEPIGGDGVDAGGDG